MHTPTTMNLYAEGKLTANWEGPYVIAKKLALGSFILKNMARKELRNCWNASVLKKILCLTDRM